MERLLDMYIYIFSKYLEMHTMGLRQPAANANRGKNVANVSYL